MKCKLLLLSVGAGAFAFACACAACSSDPVGSPPDGGPVPDSGLPADAGGPDGGAPLPPLGPGVSTLAGSSQAGNADGPRGEARFSNPVNMAVGPDGNVFVADFDNSLIREVTPKGTVSTLTQPDPTFYRPFGIAFGADGMLYVQTDGDTQQKHTGALWRIDPSSGARTLLKNDAGRNRGIVGLPDGRLVMVDYQADVVRIFDPSARSSTVIAGAAGQAGYADGTGSQARFDIPYDLVLIDANHVLVSDYNNNRIREVTLDSGKVTTYAGTGQAGIAGGDRKSAEFFLPQGMAMDPDGNVYVTDSGGYVIQRIAPDGMVTTIAGAGTPGWADSSNPLAAKFYGLEGIDASRDGAYLYISDGNRGDPVPYNRVRRLTLQ